MQTKEGWKMPPAPSCEECGPCRPYAIHDYDGWSVGHWCSCMEVEGPIEWPFSEHIPVHGWGYDLLETLGFRMDTYSIHQRAGYSFEMPDTWNLASDELIAEIEASIGLTRSNNLLSEIFRTATGNELTRSNLNTVEAMAFMDGLEPGEFADNITVVCSAPWASELISMEEFKTELLCEFKSHKDFEDLLMKSSDRVEVGGCHGFRSVLSYTRDGHSLIMIQVTIGSPSGSLIVTCTVDESRHDEREYVCRQVLNSFIIDSPTVH